MSAGLYCRVSNCLAKITIITLKKQPKAANVRHLQTNKPSLQTLFQEYMLLLLSPFDIVIKGSDLSLLTVLNTSAE
jgi:hypothetical protein